MILSISARTDAQRATEKKKRKDKEIELLALGVDNNELEDQDDLKVTHLLDIRIQVLCLGPTSKKSKWFQANQDIFNNSISYAL